LEDDARATLREFGCTAHRRHRGDEAKEIAREAGKDSRRWVVERSHRRLTQVRRLLIRWKKSLSMILPSSTSPVA
jgi:putative transposase